MEHTIFFTETSELNSLKRFIDANVQNLGIEIIEVCDCNTEISNYNQKVGSLRCNFPTINSVYALAFHHGKIKALA